MGASTDQNGHIDVNRAGEGIREMLPHLYPESSAQSRVMAEPPADGGPVGVTDIDGAERTEILSSDPVVAVELDSPVIAATNVNTSTSFAPLSEEVGLAVTHAQDQAAARAEALAPVVEGDEADDDAEADEEAEAEAALQAEAEEAEAARLAAEQAEAEEAARLQAEADAAAQADAAAAAQAQADADAAAAAEAEAAAAQGQAEGSDEAPAGQ